MPLPTPNPIMAAIASVALLLQQIAVNTRSGGDANLYIAAGVLGLVMGAIAPSVARRLDSGMNVSNRPRTSLGPALPNTAARSSAATGPR